MPEAEAKEITKQRPKKKPLSLGMIIVVLIATSVGLYLSHRDTSPIPKKIRQSVNFALYYPSSLPTGYSLEKGSVKVDNNIVFYILQAGSQKISISEQAVPNPPPDLKSIQNFNTSFKNIDTLAGQVIIGTNLQSNALTAILVTNTTLVNISASKNVPQDVVATVTQNMSSLPSQR